MKKKLYLHIGFHKTGTSALQEYFHNNREELLKNGVCYIKSYDTRFPANVDLSWAINDSPPPWASFNKGTSSEILAYYNKELKANVCDTIIISSEDFCLYDQQPHVVGNLKTFLNDYDVNVVAYLRDPIEFIISLYCHAIRAGAFKSDMKSYLVDHYNFFSADYHSRLAPWLSEFGYKKLIIKKYSPKDFVNGSLIDDFFDAIGVEVEVLNPVIPISNVGTHVWLIKPYIDILNSSIDNTEKQLLLSNLNEFGKNLPRVDKANYLLDKNDIVIFNKAYKSMKKKILKEYNIEL